MKLQFQLFCCLIIFLTFQYVFAESKTSVSSQGVTIVSAKLNEMDIKIEIRTREIDIGQLSDEFPRVYESENCCTYSRYPCSVVYNIRISVNGKSIFVPRSAICDLSDLNTAEIILENDLAVLSLTGGDASESYFVKIEFNSHRVKRKILGSSIEPSQPIAITNYYELVIG